MTISSNKEKRKEASIAFFLGRTKMELAVVVYAVVGLGLRRIKNTKKELLKGF